MDNVIFGINIYGLIISFLFLALIGRVVVLKFNQNEAGADYFLAAFKDKWVTPGVSLFVMLLSGEFFLSLIILKMLAGFESLLILGISSLTVLFVVFVLVPRFISSGHITITSFQAERLKNNFTGKVNKTVLFIYSILKLSVVVFISGLLLQEILKIDMTSFLLFIIFITGVCSLVGGLTTIINLQFIQAAGIISSLMYFAIFGRNIFEVNNFIISLRSSLLKESGVLFSNEIPVFIVLILLFIAGIWNWGFDQLVFQRVISSNNLRYTAKTYLLSFSLFVITSILLTGYLFPEFIFSNVNFLMGPQERHLLPFEQGIMLMGITGWLMSSISGTFHSFSSQITFDIYKPSFPNASQQELILVARLALTILVLVTILMVPLLKLAGLGFLLYSYGMLLIIICPLTAVFLSGCLLNSLSLKGIYTSYILSGLFIAGKLISIFHDQYSGSVIGFLDINFFNLALILFFIDVFVISAFSFFESRKRNILFWNVSEALKGNIISGKIIKNSKAAGKL